MDQTVKPLATLHDALIPLPPEEPKTARQARTTVRLSKESRAKLEVLCLRHGTTASAFFSRCADLVTQEVG